MNQTIEDQSFTPDQRIWRWRILVSTYFAYADFYLVRKVFAICKTTLADEYGLGFDGGAKLVFCSTDTLFDGSKGNYCEADLPRALNYYAETKILAERAVRAAADSNVVARLSLVIGLPILGTGNSFLAQMIRQWDAGQVMRFAENEIRTPIDVVTLGRALLELAAGDATGTIHLAGNTRLNRYEMALQIADRMGYSRDLAEPIDSSRLVGRAPRPADVSLDNRKARRILQTPMRTLAEGLDLVGKPYS